MSLPNIPDGVIALLRLSGVEALYHEDTNSFRLIIGNNHWTVDDPLTFEGWHYAVGKVLDMRRDWREYS